MKYSTAARAPKRLSAEARGWWRKLVEEFAIADQGGLFLLETALVAFDRMRQAQKALEDEGLTTKDRFGQPKPHPASVIERDSRTGMLQALRALNLDVEPLHARPGRPGGS